MQNAAYLRVKISCAFSNILYFGLIYTFQFIRHCLMRTHSRDVQILLKSNEKLKNFYQVSSKGEYTLTGRIPLLVESSIGKLG